VKAFIARDSFVAGYESYTLINDPAEKTMTATPHPEPVRPADTPAELATFGPVHVDVIDRDRSLRFWRDVVGLALVPDDGAGGDDGAVALGTRREPLLVLHPGVTHPAQRGHSGLYHVAIHLPDEAEFARVLARLIAYRWPIAPTDHVMSKAIYLTDPDGIGLELTLETPERQREMRVTAAGFEVIDADGRVRSGRDPLDVEAVLDSLPDRDVERPMPSGTFVGHVHLHVGDLDPALRFYRDGIGFIENMRSDRFGFADLHAGGRFKHRMAINTWQGAGAPPAPAGTAGLRHFTIRFDSADRLHDTLSRLPDGAQRDDGVLVRDPAGNAVLLSALIGRG
jgi:catechol 2,3-dioxygenase